MNNLEKRGLAQLLILIALPLPEHPAIWAMVLRNVLAILGFGCLGFGGLIGRKE